MSDAPGRGRWRGAGRLAVSLALLWLVSRWVDVAAVAGRLSQMKLEWIALGLAISVLQVGVLAWRWRYTAARLGIDLPFRSALGEYYLGILLNQLLPGGVAGDVTRAWRHTRTDAPPGPAVRAVILERASAQIVMTLTAVVSVLALPWASWPLRALVAVAGVGLCGLVVAWLTRPPASVSSVGHLRADAHRALLAPDAVVPQIASAALVVASYISVFLVAARAIGTETALPVLLPLVAPVLMTMLIPVTVAGWGVREAAAAALWSQAGLSPDDGAAISVAYGLLVLVSSAPGLMMITRAVIGGRGRRAHPPRA